MNTEIASLLIILTGTIILLVLDILRIDIVAILCLLMLGWSGILDPVELLSGFSSTAVIVMMAVMIMGYGIDKVGVMDQFSRALLEKVGNNKKKIIAWLSIVVGLLSGFIQNIGAIALFLPGIINIARRSKISASELIMPIGFAAILGGTLTMVGSGPLILINDLLRNADLEPYGMFSVTPLGFLLLVAGIGYFLFFGKNILPKNNGGWRVESDQEKLIQKLHLPNNIHHFSIGKGSPLIGKTAEQSGIWQKAHLNLLGLIHGIEIEYSPWRETVFETGQELALLGEEEHVRNFVKENNLIELVDPTRFQALHDPTKSGFAEVIIPYRSDLMGKTIREYSIRKRYGVEPVMLFSKGREIRGDISDHKVQPGDSLIVYGLWERISELKASINFVVASLVEVEKEDHLKIWFAMICFFASIALSLVGFPVSLSFLTGAIAMVLARVLTIQEMYQAIEWKVVFLLAGLIPLGIAMQKTGAAVFLAENVISFVLGRHPVLIITTIGILATIFSLFMSNVGAIVMLTPVVIEIARIGNFDPRPLALMAAVCVANSFILPTHQVNSLIMSPGGYRNADFFKAGIWMTLIFLIIAVIYFYVLML